MMDSLTKVQPRVHGVTYHIKYEWWYHQRHICIKLVDFMIQFNLKRNISHSKCFSSARHTDDKDDFTSHLIFGMHKGRGSMQPGMVH
jgi:hypothetical protein